MTVNDNQANLPEGARIEVLRYLHEKALGQWNERRKYEWMAFFEFSTFVAAVAAVIVGRPTRLNQCGSVLFSGLVVSAAGAIVWFLAELQKKNSSDDKRVRGLNDKLVELAQLKELLKDFKLQEYKWWSFGPQVLFISLVSFGLLVLFWCRVP